MDFPTIPNGRGARAHKVERFVARRTARKEQRIKRENNQFAIFPKHHIITRYEQCMSFLFITSIFVLSLFFGWFVYWLTLPIPSLNNKTH